MTLTLSMWQEALHSQHPSSVEEETDNINCLHSVSKQRLQIPDAPPPLCLPSGLLWQSSITYPLSLVLMGL